MSEVMTMSAGPGLLSYPVVGGTEAEGNQFTDLLRRAFHGEHWYAIAARG